MTAFTAVKILLVGGHSLLGREILRLAPSIPAELITVDWQPGDEPAPLLCELARQQPCYVLCAWTVSEISPSRESYKALLCLLAQECAKLHCKMLFVTDNQVYDGIKNTPYVEEDAFAPLNELGKWSVKLEQELKNTLDDLLILRTGWVFSAQGDNYLTRLLKQAERGETLLFNSAVSACPSSAADLARVIFAIIQQLSAGARCQGTYHYCSAGVTNGYQFAEALLAIAGQYSPDLAEDKIRLAETHCDSDEVLFVAPVVLSCQKLLNSFGIKQRPWKTGLVDIVKEYFGQGDKVKTSASCNQKR